MTKPSFRILKHFFFVSTLLLAQSPDELLQSGRQALDRGDYPAAEKYFADLTNAAPSAIAFDYLATAEANLGDMGKAIGSFHESIRLGNNSGDVHFGLGLALVKADRYKEGIAEMTLALARQPDLNAAKYALGVALMEDRRPRQALVWLEQARRQTPKDPAIWANLVRAHFEAGDPKAAVVSIDNATEAFPQDASVAVTLAQLCMQHGEVQKARTLLENASELLPDNAEVKLLLARASLEAKDPEEAYAVLKDLATNAGAPGEVEYLRGSALLMAGKLKEAGADLSAAVAAAPEKPEYLVGTGWIDQLQGRYEEAGKSLSEALALDPHSTQALYRLALNYFLLKDYRMALDLAQKRAALQPPDQRVAMLTGLIAIERGDLKEAEQVFRKVISTAPNSAVPHRELGIVLFREKGLTESKSELDKAIALNAKDAQAYVWRAKVLEALQRRQEAIEDLERAAALQPDRGDALAELAKIYRAAGDSAKERATAVRLEAIPNKDGHLNEPMPDALQ